MTKFNKSPLCHPERSGGIYSTVAIPNLQGHHKARIAPWVEMTKRVNVYLFPEGI